MTHHTDAERAELCAIIQKHLAACTKNMENYSYFGRNMGVSEDDYEEISAEIAADIQAARSAPVAPVPQSEPVGSVYTMEALVPGGREVQHVSLYMPLPAGTKLYAAPQPPEAAPDCLTCNDHGAVGNILNAEPCPDCTMKRGTGCSVSNGETKTAPVELPEYGIDTANHAGIRVRGYTEQQVRELLAAHGIGGAA